MTQASEVVKDAAESLRSYPFHVEPGDWDYSRENVRDMKHIRYRSDYTGYDRIDRRFVRAVKNNFLPVPKGHWSRPLRERSLRSKFVGFWFWLRKDSNMPDGGVNRGAVITFWEEDGEYLQLVQPSVGALVADLLEAAADLPEAQAVAMEIKAIEDRYYEPRACLAQVEAS